VLQDETHSVLVLTVSYPLPSPSPLPVCNVLCLPELENFGSQSLDSIAPSSKFLISNVMSIGDAVDERTGDFGIDAICEDRV
jgi:hypothetical protein